MNLPVDNFLRQGSALSFNPRILQNVLHLLKSVLMAKTKLFYFHRCPDRVVVKPFREGRDFRYGASSSPTRQIEKSLSAATVGRELVLASMKTAPSSL